MSLPRVAGKIAIITGAASGIGSAICSKLAGEGASVVLVDRNQNKLKSKFTLLSDVNENNHHHICGDVSQSNFAEYVFQNVKEKYNLPGHVIVNCAGITRDSLFLNMKEEDFDEVINVNLKSTFVMTKAFVSSLKMHGFENASIINVSSIIGKQCYLFQIINLFNVATLDKQTMPLPKLESSGLQKLLEWNWGGKKILIAELKSYRNSFQRFGIRCNAILPGFIETPMTEVVPQTLIDKIVKRIPTRRMGTPEEVANACLFLASDESSYVNCASLEVTGGLMA